MQILRFQQKEDNYLSVDALLDMNRNEANRYKLELQRKKTRFMIEEEKEEADGSVIIKIRKEYNAQTDVSPYF